MQLPKTLRARDPDTARLHRDWLRNLPGITGETLTRIAHESDISASTLTRPLKEGEDGHSTLNVRTIAKVVARYGVEPPAGVAALPKGSRSGIGLAEEAAPYRGEPGDPVAAAVKALVGDSLTVTPWTLRTRALELAGYMPGDVVLVDLNGVPKPGDAVCAQVYDWARGRAETVMRVLERATPVDLLVARSLDPELQTPLVVDGERVVVKGVLLPHRLRAAT